VISENEKTSLLYKMNNKEELHKRIFRYKHKHLEDKCFLRNVCKDKDYITRCYDDKGTSIDEDSNKLIERNSALHERHYQLAITRFIALENLTKENVDYLLDDGKLTLHDILDHYVDRGIEMPDGLKYYMLHENNRHSLYDYPKCTPDFRNKQETFEELKTKLPKENNDKEEDDEEYDLRPPVPIAIDDDEEYDLRQPEQVDNEEAATGAGDATVLTKEDIERRRREYSRLMERAEKQSPKQKRKTRKVVRFSKSQSKAVSKTERIIAIVKSTMKEKYPWIMNVSNVEIKLMHNYASSIVKTTEGGEKTERSLKLEEMMKKYGSSVHPNLFARDFDKQWKAAQKEFEHIGGKRKKSILKRRK